MPTLPVKCLMVGAASTLLQGTTAMTTTQQATLKADLLALIPAVSAVSLAQNQERSDLIGGMVRLPFHDAFGGGAADGGTKANGCLDPNESEHGGLEIIRDEVDPVCDTHAAFSSRADCWALAGSVAIEASGGVPLPFRYGRLDCAESDLADSDAGLLPSATPAGNPWCE
jgi:catalase (peroxidase I)